MADLTPFPRFGVCPAEAIDASTIGNHLLLAVPLREREVVAKHLQRVPLRTRQMLMECSLPVRDIYFIERGAACVLSRPKFHCIDVGMIGRMGVVGIPAILGTDRSPFRCVVEIAGAGLRMKADRLPDLMDELPAFRQMLFNYVQARIVQQAQLVVCNSRHSVKQRLARWFLMALDRMDGTEIPVTHELLSRMLGVRRAGITMTISAMESHGILERRRGCIKILDTANLHEAACECHGLIRSEYCRLIRPARAVESVPAGVECMTAPG